MIVLQGAHRGGCRNAYGDTLATATAWGAVAIGAGFPAVFFILAALHAMELGTAFSLAKWSGLGLLFAYSWAASRLAGSSITRATLHASAVGAIGVALIVVKALLH